MKPNQNLWARIAKCNFSKNNNTEYQQMNMTSTVKFGKGGIILLGYCFVLFF